VAAVNELEFVEGRIRHHRKRLEKAEADYHHAVTYGELHDMHAKLVECQAIRAKLLEYLHRRDELTGGASHAKNQR
jgi:hypothetical protein